MTEVKNNDDSSYIIPMETQIIGEKEIITKNYKLGKYRDIVPPNIDYDSDEYQQCRRDFLERHDCSVDYTEQDLEEIVEKIKICELMCTRYIYDHGFATFDVLELICAQNELNTIGNSPIIFKYDYNTRDNPNFTFDKSLTTCPIVWGNVSEEFCIVIEYLLNNVNFGIQRCSPILYEMGGISMDLRMDYKYISLKLCDADDVKSSNRKRVWLPLAICYDDFPDDKINLTTKSKMKVIKEPLDEGKSIKCKVYTVKNIIFPCEDLTGLNFCKLDLTDDIMIRCFLSRLHSDETFRRSFNRIVKEEIDTGVYSSSYDFDRYTYLGNYDEMDYSDENHDVHKVSWCDPYEENQMENRIIFNKSTMLMQLCDLMDSKDSLENEYDSLRRLYNNTGFFDKSFNEFRHWYETTDSIKDKSEKVIEMSYGSHTMFEMLRNEERRRLSGISLKIQSVDREMNALYSEMNKRAWKVTKEEIEKIRADKHRRDGKKIESDSEQPTPKEKLDFLDELHDYTKQPSPKEEKDEHTDE